MGPGWGLPATSRLPTGAAGPALALAEMAAASFVSPAPNAAGSSDVPEHAKVTAVGQAGLCPHMRVHICACPASEAGCSCRGVYLARARQEGERLENSLS